MTETVTETVTVIVTVIATVARQRWSCPGRARIVVSSNIGAGSREGRSGVSPFF